MNESLFIYKKKWRFGSGREHSHLFLEDILEFSLEREINLSIDLVPAMKPISIALYRMSPLELAKLKKQIEELLEKQFIKPSASP